MGMLGKEGGATFNDLFTSSGYDAEELMDMLKDLVESGKARAAQNGRNVVYALG
jgi:predicted transcriptional regulator